MTKNLPRHRNRKPIITVTPTKEDLLPHIDPIRPAHYGGADDPFETIKVAEAKLTTEELVGAYKFQVQTYLDRHRQKGGFLDLKKAQFYLNRLVYFLEREGLQETLGPQT